MLIRTYLILHFKTKSSVGGVVNFHLYLRRSHSCGIHTGLVVVLDTSLLLPWIFTIAKLSREQHDNQIMCLADTEAEEAGQEAGVCPEALHIAAAVTAAALSVAVHQPTPLGTVHLLAQKDGLLLARAGAGAGAGPGAGAHQRRGPLEAPHLQEERATLGQGPGRLLAARREKRG